MNGALPRWVRVFGIPVVGVLLVLLFMLLRFPYERLLEPVAAQVSQASGTEVTIQHLGPALTLAGPAVEALGVRATLADGTALMAERARVRPAWSLSWLRLSPAIHLTVWTPLGEVEGTLVLSEERSWDGDVRDLDLARLPWTRSWGGTQLAARATGSLDVRLGAEGPEGELRFETSEGSLSLPGFPVALPFDRVTGDLALEGAKGIAVRSFELEGPMVSAEATGTIGRARQIAMAPLRLEVGLEAEPSMRGPLASAGVRLGPDGTARLRISGTPSRPVIR